MTHDHFRAAALATFVAVAVCFCPDGLVVSGESAHLAIPSLRDPVWYYSNWSAYDELSDNVELTEELAMKQLAELIRLRKQGVKLDYYLMDAFWYAPDGGYRTWRKPHWPNGPDRWIAACKQNGIEPGLWFAANRAGKGMKLDVAPSWRNSFDEGEDAMSFSEGDYLRDFMDVLQFWYDRGIRMFKLDFANFNAALPATRRALSVAEIRERNKSALREALRAFRWRNPQAVFLAYNGFIEVPSNPQTMSALQQVYKTAPVDLRWLAVFDSLYSGDAHPGDVPQINIWRSMDLYSDQEVRYYERKFVPLERIDSAGFMTGDTNTSLRRKVHAWQGMLVLNAARGGWINTIYGSLQYIDDEKAKWFARVQRIYLPLQAAGRTKTFGGRPGTDEPYGFGSLDSSGSIYTIVNPSQEVRTLRLPALSRVQAPLRNGRTIFRDAGFTVDLQDNTATLGPGQMASIGFGRYAGTEFDLGIQQDVVIPRSIRRNAARFARTNDHAIETSFEAPAEGDIRVICQQSDGNGDPLPTEPNRETKPAESELLRIWAKQDGKSVPVHTDHNFFIFSGLSWNAAEISGSAVKHGTPVTVGCSTADNAVAHLQGDLYEVDY